MVRWKRVGLRTSVDGRRPHTGLPRRPLGAQLVVCLRGVAVTSTSITTTSSNQRSTEPKRPPSLTREILLSVLPGPKHKPIGTIKAIILVSVQGLKVRQTNVYELLHKMAADGLVQRRRRRASGAYGEGRHHRLGRYQTADRRRSAPDGEIQKNASADWKRCAPDGRTPNIVSVGAERSVRPRPARK